MLKQKVMLMALILIVGLAGYVRADLIGLYNFEGDFMDTSGSATVFDGTPTATPPSFIADTPRGSGQAVEFDGTGLNCGNVAGEGLDVTLAFWIKESGGTNTYAVCISKILDGDTAGQSGYCAMTRGDDENHSIIFRMGAYQSYGGWGEELRTSDNVYQLDSWNHLVFTYVDATDTATAYLNGEFDAEMTGIQGRGPTGAANKIEDLLMGSLAPENFEGMLDEVAIWDEALTPEQARDVYEFGAQPAGAKNPNPENRETVSTANPLTLSWTNMTGNPDPADPNFALDVYVDVWWGTEPNELNPAYDMTLIVDAESVDFKDVDSSAVDTYYWRVDSYLNGADNINEPNRFEGQLWSYTAVDDAAPTVEIVTPDQMTWLGEGVPLDATVTDDGVSALTYLWTADPPHGVAFDSDSIEDPIVMITGRNLVREIQDSWDDGEQYINSMASGASVEQGTMTMDSSDLELGSEGNGGLDWQVIAVQYNQLGIPQGSTITSAKLTFQVDNSGAAGTSNDFTILAEAADDASVFEDVLNNITDRARSAASVAWAPDWGTGPVVGTKVDTPDITTLIQEVVDRAGWSDNNRLTLMIYPDVYLASPTGGTTTVQEIEFEANPGSDSATLRVTYDPPAGSTPLSVPSTFTITVAVSDEANPTPDTASIVIDVYDDACQMAKFGEGKSAVTDFNANCISSLEDFAVIAGAWLDDYSATGPADRP